MDSDRNRDTYGQGHRRTGTGTQTDSGRNTKGKGKGHKGTGKGTQRDRERDTKGQGKGHKLTRTGIRTRTSTILTDNLQNNKSVKSVNFKKIQQNALMP